MKIAVTQQDIDNGQKGKTDACPIALAVERAFPTKDCRAFTFTVWANDKSYDLPSEVTRFILAFDEGYKGKPFTFELNSYGGNIN